MIMKSLIRYELTLAKFGIFYNSNYTDLNTFIKYPLPLQLGVFMHFLLSEGIGIHADRYAYVVFYTHPEDKVKHEKLKTVYRNTNSFYLHETYLKKPNDLFTNYESAIIKAFALLEIPF